MRRSYRAHLKRRYRLILARDLVITLFLVLGIAMIFMAFGWLALRPDPSYGWDFYLTGAVVCLVFAIICGIPIFGTLRRNDPPAF